MNKEQITAVETEVARYLAATPPATPEANVAVHPRKKKHRKEARKIDVSINSLLDILSVILVFLMKSYSTTTVQIKPSADLQVPFSHSSLQPEDSTAITITLKDIMVDDNPVIKLENNKVPEAALSAAGQLVNPLLDALNKKVEQEKKISQRNASYQFKGIVSLIIDRHVPFPLLVQVLYTAGQAGYSNFKFVLIKVDRS